MTSTSLCDVEVGDGWARLDALGQKLKARDSAFDPRAFGFKNLKMLFEGNKDIFNMRAGEVAPGANSVQLKVVPAPKSSKKRSRQ